MTKYLVPRAAYGSLLLLFIGCEGNVNGAHDCDAGDAGWDAGERPVAEERCGNGRIEADEECDDGNVFSGDGCDARCEVELEPIRCGNRRLEQGEECDDGNVFSEDGCSALCQFELPPAIPGYCGDYRVAPGEECEPPSSDVCDATCRVIEPAQCGNGVLEPGESCDDGNLDSKDGCSSLCRVEDVAPGDDDEPTDGGTDAMADDDLADDDTADDTADDDDVADDDLADDDTTIVDDDTAVDDDTIDDDLPDDDTSAGGNPSSGGFGGSTGGNGNEPGSGGSGGMVGNTTGGSGGTAGGGSGGSGGGGNPAAGDSLPCDDGVDLNQNSVADCAETYVQNSQFQQEPLDPWYGHSTAPAVVLARNSESADAMASSGSLEVRLNSPLDEQSDLRIVAGAAQCIQLDAGRTLELLAEYLITDSAPLSTHASAHVFFYDAADCAGESFGVWGSAQFTERGQWSVLDGSLTTPAGTRSLLLRLNVSRIVKDGRATIQYDNVLLADFGLLPGVCGDNTLNAGENCDDGNTTSGDGCSDNCQLETACGDGVVEGSEQCDPPNGVDCDANCRVLDDPPGSDDECGECSRTQCTTPYDACTQAEGTASAGPATGTPKSTLCKDLVDCALRTSCAAQDGNLAACYCGNLDIPTCVGRTGSGTPNGLCKAVIEAAAETTDAFTIASRLEQDDDPTFASVRAADLIPCQVNSCADQCTQPAICGNGSLENPEECDDGNNNAGDGCSPTCRREAVCGDGYVVAPEECEDGNDVPGDGCFDCRFELPCGNGMPDPGEECDDGNSTAGDGCDAMCREERCGNGRLDAGEMCDDGNTIDGDGCSNSCMPGGNPCDMCTAVHCSDLTAGCNDQDCGDVLACAGNTDCADAASLDCYCGPGVSTLSCVIMGAQGSCADEIATGCGTQDPQAIFECFVNPLFATGSAFQIVECRRSHCSSECGLTPSN